MLDRTVFKLRFALWACAFGLCLISSLAVAAEYEYGNKALQIWDDQGKANAPQWVHVWLKCLAITYLSGLFFVIKHVEARWMVGGVLLGLVFSRIIIPSSDVVLLAGLFSVIHVVFWTPGLYLLLRRQPFRKGLSFYSVWAGLATLMTLFSFIFDVPDAVIYLHHILS